VCEITNGRFVEAKQEESWLAVGPLWSNLAGRSGSASDIGSSNLSARKLTPKLSGRTADIRGRPLLFRVVGYLPGERKRVSIRHDLRAGVAQASREETA
jgi:hypothetical protein